MIFTKKMDVVDKAQLVIFYLLRLLVVLAMLEEAMNKEWFLFVMTALIFISTIVPFWILKRFKISFPIEFELMIVIFVYASILLGSLQDYYEAFWWFDSVLHAISGLILGFFGFIIIFSLYKQDKIKTSPLFIGLFSFCFAVAAGTVWEIYEFSIDSLFGFNTQESGLVDTMWDLILDSITALIAAILGALYIRGNEPPVFNRLVGKFIFKNKWIFKKREFRRLKKLKEKIKTLKENRFKKRK